MTELLQSMDFWHWWTLALVFLVLEVVVSGFYLIWMAVAAVLIGIIVWVSPGMFWQQQWLLFGGFSLISMLAWFRFGIKPESEESNGLNRRADYYKGQTFTLETAIEDGYGRVKIEDTLWRVSGPDMEKGQQVIVVQVDGGKLVVEAVK